MNPLKNLTPILLLAFATSSSATTFSVLTDDFELYPTGPLPLSLPATPAGNPPPPGVAGDPAEIIGATDGVTPRSGSQMLRFLNTYHLPPFTTGTNSDLYYILDLSFYAASLADGTGSVDLSAWFNTGTSGFNNHYFLGLSAYDETFNLPDDIRQISPPSRLATLNNFSTPLVADSNAATWEQSAISLGLPAETRFLAVRLGAHQNANGAGFISSFAEDVQVDLQLPNGYIENPSELPASGSTIVFLSTALAGLVLAGSRKKDKSQG